MSFNTSNMEDILDKIRDLYILIYTYYQSNGRERIETVRASPQGQNNPDRMEAYQKLVSDLPLPKESSVDQMVSIAREVVMNNLEIDFGKIASNGKMLGHIGREILVLARELADLEKQAQWRDSCYRVVPFKRQDVGTYFEEAANVYF